MVSSRYTGWRVAAWAGAVIVLLIPFVAMQFTDQVNWSLGDFVFAALLLFGAVGGYQFLTKSAANAFYRAGAGVAIGATLLLLWANGAVGITNTRADVFYFWAVPAILLAGALVSRFGASGLSKTTLTVAAVLPIIAVMVWWGDGLPGSVSTTKLWAITGFFSFLYVGAGHLYHLATNTIAQDDDR